MERPISFGGYKEQESNLILPEHDDDDEYGRNSERWAKRQFSPLGKFLAGWLAGFDWQFYEGSTIQQCVVISSLARVDRIFLTRHTLAVSGT